NAKPVCRVMRLWCFFFFQAEDGIRDFHVTGVQTCALPILVVCGGSTEAEAGALLGTSQQNVNRVKLRALRRLHALLHGRGSHVRSEERRVGKEGRARWWVGECGNDGGSDVR